MATFIVGGILAAIVAAVIWKMISDRKKGKGHCGCSGNCACCKGCH